MCWSFSKLEVFIEHIPRAVMNVYRPGCMQCIQLYTIDVCRCAMRIEQGGYRVYCVRVWPYPRCGSDRLPYILYCEAGEVGPNVTNNRK